MDRSDATLRVGEGWIVLFDCVKGRGQSNDRA